MNNPDLHVGSETTAHVFVVFVPSGAVMVSS